MSAASAAPLFAALGDPTRLAIVATLADGQPRSIAALTADGSISRQAVSKHLGVLEGAGVVRARRSGRERCFALVPRPLDEAQAYLGEITRQWDAALGRLAAHLAAG